MKKKVAITTIHNGRNSGAALQAYALHKSIVSLGHEAVFIDYRPPIKPGQKATGKLKFRILGSALLWRLLEVKRKAYYGRMQSFNDSLPRDGRRLVVPQDFRDIDWEYDSYVCGSDQIWNPSRLTGGMCEPYYLDFVKGGRKVSYAPSFGVEEIPAEYRARMAELIGGIDVLSAREKSGVRIVEELTGRKAEHVLDPTLLVNPEVFDDITEDPDIDRPFAFVYATQYPKKREQVEVMRGIARKLGLRLVVAMPGTFHPKWLLEPATFLWATGPRQFLGLIRKASLVITNSYHGTALSIALRKNFAVIPHAHFNTRMESLLEILDLGSRQLAPDASPSNMERYLEPVDYAAVEPLLSAERRRSREFLRRAIEG